jgi:hypothetical protein
VSDFNFTVGTTVTADPHNYVVNASTLNVASIVSGAPVAIRGLVAPWNQSPPGSSGAQNAMAITVVDRSAFAGLFVDWAFAAARDVTATTGEIDLDMTGTVHHFVDPGFIAPIVLTGTVKIVPASTPAMFAIGQAGSLTLYNDFATFEADLAAKLAAGGKAKAVMAIGAWSSSSNTLTALKMGVFVQ